MADDAKPQKAKKEKSTSPFRDNIEVVIFAITMSLGLKVFALEAYQIPTGSMQPTLMGTDLVENGRPVGGVHDRVLVDKICYLIREPRRWEVVVFRYPLATINNYVKRLIGMPGEDLWIQEGDIWTRPLGSNEDYQIQRKPLKVQRDLWKQVYPKPGADHSIWTNWRFQKMESEDANGVATLQAGATLSYPAQGTIQDNYLDGYPVAMVSRVPVGGSGAHSRSRVSDLRFAFRATPGAELGALHFEPECGAFRFELTLATDGSQLLTPSGEVVSLDFTPRAGRAVEVDFAFWDHHWHLELDGKSWSGDLEAPARTAPRNGVVFRADSSWQLEPVTIWRDIHYLPSLQGGVGQYEIPEGEYFMMGDNTQNSLDSRDWTARQLHFDPPLDGISFLRGDDLPEGHDPTYNNPRFSMHSDDLWFTLRDEWGDLHTLLHADVVRNKQPDQPELISWHTVPREYIQGKALAVFLPVPPFSPVWRIGWVH